VRVEDEKALVEMPGEGGVLVAAGKKRRRRVVAA